MEGKIRLSVFFFSPKANMKFQLAHGRLIRAKYKNWKGFLKRKKNKKEQFFLNSRQKKEGKKEKKLINSLQLICIEHRLHVDQG